MSAEPDRSVLGGDRGRLRQRLYLDSLSAEMTHVVGRTRAFLLELAASERELRSVGDPRASWVIAAIAATQDGTVAGSLTRVEQAGTELLRLLNGSGGTPPSR
jgi:hypothetical protein